MPAVNFRRGGCVAERQLARSECTEDDVVESLEGVPDDDISVERRAALELQPWEQEDVATIVRWVRGRC